MGDVNAAGWPGDPGGPRSEQGSGQGQDQPWKPPSTVRWKRPATNANPVNTGVTSASRKRENEHYPIVSSDREGKVTTNENQEDGKTRQLQIM